MLLIVGLGNPGKEYTQTRHNLGFQVLDALADKIGAPAWKTQSKALLTKIPQSPFILAKPQTYVNLSGIAVAELLRFYQLGSKNLLVITDDLALPVGKLRLRLAGSSGGHNGLASIEKSLGTNEFARLRLGIGQPSYKTQTNQYVLSTPSPAEADLLEHAIHLATQFISEYRVDNPFTAKTF